MNTESLLEQLGGCGLFQVVFATLAYAPHIGGTFTMLFMSFGAYNPGWTCNKDYDILSTNVTRTADDLAMHSYYLNNTETSTVTYIDNVVAGSDNLTSHQLMSSCQAFQTCKGNVTFIQDASTIVTEWSLVCEKSWISSIIMSLQMIGVLIGAFCNGILGDKFGRKFTLYIFLFFNIILNALAVWSTSWAMYMTIRFFLGVTCGVIGYMPCLYITEFVPPLWRVRISSLPLWSFGAIMFSVSAMLTKDWKSLHIINTVVSAVAFLPVFWVPESLRWLAVHGKKEKARAVTDTLARWNKTPLDIESVDSFLTQQENHLNAAKQTATLKDLFERDTIRFTLIFGAVFLSIDLVYYATSFGVSALPGNMYTNMIILFVTDLIANPIAFTLPNIIGRRRTCVLCYIILALCLYGVIFIELIHSPGQIKALTLLILIVVARICLSIEWYVLLTFISEIYPTVVRSTATGYGGLMAAIGAILAPYVIPSDPSQLYIGYSVMAGLVTLCCLALPFMPETKGKPLKDTWMDVKEDFEMGSSETLS